MVPRLAIYGATSTALAGIVIASAIQNRANFFAAAVTIGKSSGSLMVLANFALFIVICFGIALKKLFFGQLRSIEYEHLFERLWLFLTESLLALTIFRDDFSAPFVVMYSTLLFLKCFHWITADRVDYMDQVPPPGPPIQFHIRVLSIINLLLTADIFLVRYSISSVSTQGMSSMVLFASEFMILLASGCGTFARYIVGVMDLHRARGRVDAPAWEQKSMYLFYIDLAVDFVKLLTYLTFFSVIFLRFGLPLHILRDVYMTFRSFLSRCSDLVRYRRATRDMDAQYPNATPAEMDALADKTCIICREEMVLPGAEGSPQPAIDGPNETPKKLVCGHIFHFHCLRSWLERQQSCPTCRRDVLRNPVASRRNAPAIPLFAPPPAPGQAPALPQQQNAGVNGWPFADRNNGPVQPPGVNGHIPTPTHAPAAPLFTEETESDRIQRGIWGGPITPGQFFPQPLGAGPSRASLIPPRRISSRLEPTPIVPTPAAFSTSAPGETDASLASASSSIHSGNHTPFTSNPPQVFSSTGAPRTRRSNSSSSGGTATLPAESDVEQSAEGAEATEDATSEVSKRRVAAEAAMRRLGLRSSTRRMETSPNGTLDPKGKSKAVEPEPIPIAPEDNAAVPESLDDPPKHIPYLTRTTPGSLSSRWGLPGGSVNSSRWSNRPPTPAQGLEDRVALLRDVDEAIWGLMGELAKVKSRWEVEDAAAGSGGAEHAPPHGSETN